MGPVWHGCLAKNGEAATGWPSRALWSSSSGLSESCLWRPAVISSLCPVLLPLHVKIITFAWALSFALRRRSLWLTYNVERWPSFGVTLHSPIYRCFPPVSPSKRLSVYQVSSHQTLLEPRSSPFRSCRHCPAKFPRYLNPSPGRGPETPGVDPGRSRWASKKSLSAACCV